MKHKHTLKTRSALRGIIQHQRKSWLALGMASLLAAGGANAALYISTLGAGTLGAVMLNASTTHGIAFRTGTDSQAYLLDQVVGLFQMSSGSESAGFEAHLYEADSAGTPTLLLDEVSFTHSAIVSSSAGQITFTPTTAVELEANKFYAFVVKGADSSVSGYMFGVSHSNFSPTTDVPGSGWELPRLLAYSVNGGGSWNDGGGGAYRYVAGIYATPIPEPSSMFLVSGAVVLASVGIRRRK